MQGVKVTLIAVAWLLINRIMNKMFTDFVENCRDGRSWVLFAADGWLANGR